MRRYPARVTHTKAGLVMLVLPDVPEVVVVAQSEGEAIARAPAMLDLVLQGYRSEGRRLPKASRISGAAIVSCSA